MMLFCQTIKSLCVDFISNSDYILAMGEAHEFTIILSTRQLVNSSTHQFNSYNYVFVP